MLTLIVCVSETGYLSFNGRCLPIDQCVFDDISTMLKDECLYYIPIKKNNFVDCNGHQVISIHEEMFSIPKDGDKSFVFTEVNVSHQFAIWVDKLIVYKSGREYPGDTKFFFDLTEFNNVGQTEMFGQIHDKITRTVYVRSPKTRKERSR